jgi:hypothetical protein
LRLNVVLVNLVMQQVKLQLILAFGVSFEACGVHAGTPFRDKMVAVAVYETGNPGISGVLLQYIRCKILDHSSCRR